MRDKAITKQNAPPNIRTAFCRCLHLTTGRTVIPKTCIYAYECRKCPFDQWLDELDTRGELLTAAA